MNDISIELSIIAYLKRKDIPLLAHHISKGINKSPQSVDYNIKKLVKEGVILIEHVEGSKYYYLQPTFYMRDAETTLMQLITPWVKEFSIQTKITEDTGVSRDEAVIKSLFYYFQQFFKDLQENLE